MIWHRFNRHKHAALAAYVHMSTDLAASARRGNESRCAHGIGWPGGRRYTGCYALETSSPRARDGPSTTRREQCEWQASSCAMSESNTLCRAQCADQRTMARIRRLGCAEEQPATARTAIHFRAHAMATALHGNC